MVRIGTTEWDDEQLHDRVNVIRRIKAQSSSGQSVPTETTVLTNVPCSIQYAGSTLQVGTALQVLAEDHVMFAEDLQLKPDDILVPVTPSSGPRIRVGQARWEQMFDLKVYHVVGKQTT